MASFLNISFGHQFSEGADIRRLPWTTSQKSKWHFRFTWWRYPPSSAGFWKSFKYLVNIHRWSTRSPPSPGCIIAKPYNAEAHAFQTSRTSTEMFFSFFYYPITLKADFSPFTLAWFQWQSKKPIPNWNEWLLWPIWLLVHRWSRPDQGRSVSLDREYFVSTGGPCNPHKTSCRFVEWIETTSCLSNSSVKIWWHHNQSKG